MNYEISTTVFIVLVVIIAAIFLSLAIYIVGQMEKIGQPVEKPIEYQCENCNADVSHEETLGNACPSCMCGSHTARKSSWFKIKRV